MKEIYSQSGTAKRLQLLRKAKGFTQKQMSELMEISCSLYVKLENTNSGLRIKHLAKICSLFNTTSDLILFGNTGDENINFAEYIKCVEMLSANGLESMEESIRLMKKMKSTYSPKLVKE